MILIDFTGLVFQYTHSCVSTNKLELNENNKYNSSEILPYLKTFLLNELFDIYEKHSNDKIVLCVDNTHKKNWRKEYYRHYKASRHIKDNPIPFAEIFKDLNELLKQLRNTPFHVVNVEGAEADDCILTLSHMYSQYENILIISSDKDMLQAQRDKNVKQYSPLLKKYITYKDKDVDNINDWIIEHVVLGDTADDVPRIFDNTEYTDEFVQFLKANNIDTDIKKYEDIPIDVLSRFDGDVFKKLRIGSKKIQKMIKDGTIKDFILQYKDNYIRNRTLILSEYIPSDIQKTIVDSYKTNVSEQYSPKQIDDFINYLYDTKLQNVIDNIPTDFRKSVVTIDDFI